MVLESIYKGECNPCENIQASIPEYSKEIKKESESIEKLKMHLDGSDQQLLDDLIDQIQNVHELENKAFFKMGFAMGLDLQKDAAEQISRL